MRAGGARRAASRMRLGYVVRDCRPLPLFTISALKEQAMNPSAFKKHDTLARSEEDPRNPSPQDEWRATFDRVEKSVSANSQAIRENSKHLRAARAAHLAALSLDGWQPTASRQSPTTHRACDAAQNECSEEERRVCFDGLIRDRRQAVDAYIVAEEHRRQAVQAEREAELERLRMGLSPAERNSETSSAPFPTEAARKRKSKGFWRWPPW